MSQTIYLIEDEILLCELFEEYIKVMPQLNFLGYSRDGQDGIAACLRHRPDLLVLDIRLPEVNGLEILHILRKKLPDMRILVFTGTINDRTLRIALEHGVHAFVEKAQGLDELRRGIEKVMQDESYYSRGIQQIMRTFHGA